MKKLLIIAVILLSAVSGYCRMPEASDVAVRDLKATREGTLLRLTFTLDLSGMPSGLNTETRLTPVIKGGIDSVRLESVTVAGRNRYIQAERTGAVRNEGNSYYRAGKVKSIGYSAATEWEPWMSDAGIELLLENLGCCESRKSLAGLEMAQLNMGERNFEVALQYITPVEERVKLRNVRGQAYVDFKLNKTNILPDYRNNPEELAKIRATIDSIKSDKDMKITRLSIAGYASPEGPYANNERLARGRTEALARYVQGLYTFPAKLMRTSWEAEDWYGLRKMVEKSDLKHKAQILVLIDSEMSPDAKDAKLKNDYPAEYEYMLENFYPALRRSEYVVEFEVRQYTDPAEIAAVFRKNPTHLSLRELFIYAETLDPKSKEYGDVFRTAAAMYPEDATANLNAGNVALGGGDLTAAARYLAKAGDTPEASYARGVLAAKEGKYSEAAKEFARAKAGGINIRQAEEEIAKMTAPEVFVRK